MFVVAQRGIKDASTLVLPTRGTQSRAYSDFPNSFCETVRKVQAKDRSPSRVRKLQTSLTDRRSYKSVGRTGEKLQEARLKRSDALLLELGLLLPLFLGTEQ